MGDTGSLALGGALGIVAVLIHQPLVLVIAGGVFVLEAASVILQTGWYRYTSGGTDRSAPLPDGFPFTTISRRKGVRIASRDAILHLGCAVCCAGPEHIEDPRNMLELENKQSWSSVWAVPVKRLASFSVEAARESRAWTGQYPESAARGGQTAPARHRDRTRSLGARPSETSA